MPGVGVQPGCSAEGERLLPLSHPSGGAGWQSPSCTSPTCLHLPCCAAGPGSSNPSSLCVPRNTGHALGSSDPPSLPRNTGHAPGSSNPLPKDTVHGLRSQTPPLSVSQRIQSMVRTPQTPPLPLFQCPFPLLGPPARPPAPELAEPLVYPHPRPGQRRWALPKPPRGSPRPSPQALTVSLLSPQAPRAAFPGRPTPSPSRRTAAMTGCPRSGPAAVAPRAPPSRPRAPRPPSRPPPPQPGLRRYGEPSWSRGDAEGQGTLVGRGWHG